MWSEAYSQRELTTLALYRGDEKVKDLALTDRLITDLFSNNDYLLRATYLSGEEVKTVDYAFKTQAKATPVLEIKDPAKTQTDIGFVIGETDVDNVGAVTKIELLHGNDTPVVADNLEVRSFANLLSNNTYTVRVTYVYNLNDGAGDQTTVKTLEIKTDSKAEPVFVIQNEAVTQNSITAEYTQTDADGILQSYKVELYKGSSAVMENAEKKIEFSGLNYYTDYTVQITYTYDLNDGRGVQTGTAKKAWKTLPYVDVNDCAIINVSAVSEGDTIYLQANLDNPLEMKISEVVINGKTYRVTGASTAAKLYIEILCGDQFEGGTTQLTVERVVGSIDGTTYTLQPPTIVSDSIFINGTLEVLKMEFVDSNFDPIEWAVPSDTVYAMLTLDNPTGYAVNSITTDFPDTTITPIKLSNDRYYFPVPNTVTGWWSLTSLSYSNEYISKTISTSIGNFFMRLDSDGIRYVSTPEDLLNMGGGRYYYELTNDIDLSGRQWLGNDFLGVFDGKGYSIKNLTYVGSVNDENVSLGLFANAEGLIKDLTMERVMIMANGEAWIHAGAFAGTGGRMEFLCLKNCTVDADSVISIATEREGSVGGLIGGDYDGAITMLNCRNYGTVAGNGSLIEAGGLVGTFSVGTIQSCFDSGTITSGWRAGGMIGRDESGTSTVNNSYTTKVYNTVFDVLCTTEQLNTASFYTDTLGWSTEVWDFSDLDVANGKYPKLK